MIRHAFWLCLFDFVLGLGLALVFRRGFARAVTIATVGVGSALVRHYWPAIRSGYWAEAQAWAPVFLPTDIMFALVATGLGVIGAAWMQEKAGRG